MSRDHADAGRKKLRWEEKAAERLFLSERDSLRVLELLETPTAAPARLVRAAKAGGKLE